MKALHDVVQRQQPKSNDGHDHDVKVLEDVVALLQPKTAGSDGKQQAGNLTTKNDAQASELSNKSGVLEVDDLVTEEVDVTTGFGLT